ncbi:MAG: SDR family oxidoreductase [Candidatus Riflebacteria bacterium]|nr:SDR family oxidoreductase [Candidatus Riflebacteria bacterium]
MNLCGKKVLVTGSDGFIGSHLTEELVKMGCSVRAFVFYNSFNSRGWLDDVSPDIQKSIDFFAGDIRDPYGVRTAVKGCDVVFHLAALIAIPFSYHSPDSYIDTNVKGTLNILQAARDLNISKVVQTSTSEVYGTARFVPITEAHPLQGQSPYSASKIAADALAMSFFYSFNTPVSIIRPFNTYGPRQSARAIIPTVISQIASGKKQIVIGSTHPTRDLNFISDTIDGFIKFAESDSSIGETMNIGSNFEVSIGDLVKIISKTMAADIEIISSKERLRPSNSEVERLWADNSKARDLLKWHPEFAGIEGLKKGLKITADWFGKAENLKKYKTDLYNI